MDSPERDAARVRDYLRALGYFAGMAAAVAAYMGIALGFGYAFGAAGVLGWVIGSLVLAGVFMVAGEEAARGR